MFLQTEYHVRIFCILINIFFRTFDAITILGTNKFADKILVNGKNIAGQFVDSGAYIGIVSIDSVDAPPLDKTYNIEVTYRDD